MYSVAPLGDVIETGHNVSQLSLSTTIALSHSLFFLVYAMGKLITYCEPYLPNCFLRLLPPHSFFFPSFCKELNELSHPQRRAITPYYLLRVGF